MAEEKEKLLSAKLNMETAKVSWQELQRFFASGVLMKVASDLDLVDTACALATDNKTLAEKWLSEKALGPVQDDDAIHWHKQDAQLWTVVVRPWVLVQEQA